MNEDLVGRRWHRYAYVAVLLLVAIPLSSVVDRFFGVQVGDALGAWFLITPIMFGSIVQAQRQHWRHQNYWMAVVTLLAVHTAAFILTLTRFPGWRAIWVVPVAFLEAGLFFAILESLFDRSGSQ